MNRLAGVAPGSSMQDIALQFLKKAYQEVRYGDAAYLILRVLDEDGDCMFSVCTGEAHLKQKGIESLEEMLADVREAADKADHTQ